MLTTASTTYRRGWGQEEKGTTEDEMAGWCHWLDGRESEWTLGAGDGQGGLACCDSWGRKASDTTERLNWTELNWMSRLKYLGKKWCLNSTGSGWWERGKAHAPVHWRQLPDTLCCTCGDGSKVSCCFLRQTVSISTALPHPGLGSVSETTVRSGGGLSVIGKHSPRFTWIRRSSWSPFWPINLILDLEVLEHTEVVFIEKQAPPASKMLCWMLIRAQEYDSI